MEDQHWQLPNWKVLVHAAPIVWASTRPSEVVFEQLVGAQPYVLNDVIWLDHQFWALLSLNLTGGAKGILNNVPGCRGFEVWRRIVKLMNHTSEARRDQLYTKVHNPKKATKYEDVDQRLEEWSTDQRLYR